MIRADREREPIVGGQPCRPVIDERHERACRRFLREGVSQLQVGTGATLPRFDRALRRRIVFDPPPVRRAVENRRALRRRRTHEQLRGGLRRANVDRIADDPRNLPLAARGHNLGPIDGRRLGRLHGEVLLMMIGRQHAAALPDNGREFRRGVATHAQRHRSADAEIVAGLRCAARVNGREFK